MMLDYAINTNYYKAFGHNRGKIFEIKLNLLLLVISNQWDQQSTTCVVCEGKQLLIHRLQSTINFMIGAVQLQHSYAVLIGVTLLKTLLLCLRFCRAKYAQEVVVRIVVYLMVNFFE